MLVRKKFFFLYVTGHEIRAGKIYTESFLYVTGHEIKAGKIYTESFLAERNEEHLCAVSQIMCF